VTSTVPSATTQLSALQLRLVMVGLLTGMFLSGLDGTAVNTALPVIVGEFGGLDHIAWVGTAYVLSSTAATPILGKLSDLYGRRRMFQLSIAVFIVGSVLCGIAQSLLQLVLARGVQGIGGGGVLAVGFVVVGDLVPPRERGRYSGLITAVFAAASVCGPLLGGFLVDQLSWRWIFWLNLPLGALGMVVIQRALRLPFTPHARPVDWTGAALLVGSVSCLLLVTVWGGSELPWLSTGIGLLVAAGLALGALFLWYERRAPEPILPLRLFGNGTYRLVMVIAAFTGVVMFTVSAFMPLFLQTVTGVSATRSGLLMLPNIIGLTVSSVGCGRVVARTGRYKWLPIVGLSVMTVGVLVLARLDGGTSRWETGVGLFLVGLGLGAAMPILTVAVQNAVPFRDLGVATSSNHFFRSLGGALGLAAMGALLANRFTAELAGRLPDHDVEGRDYLSSPDAIRSLPVPLRGEVVESLADAVGALFLVCLPLALMCVVVGLFLEELPLRTTNQVEDDDDVGGEALDVSFSP